KSIGRASVPVALATIPDPPRALVIVTLIGNNDFAPGVPTRSQTGRIARIGSLSCLKTVATWQTHIHSSTIVKGGMQARGPMKKSTRSQISVQGAAITVVAGEHGDFISLTDMVRNFDGGFALIEQ